jgi:hypothetical protein
MTQLLGIILLAIGLSLFVMSMRVLLGHKPNFVSRTSTMVFDKRNSEIVNKRY